MKKRIIFIFLLLIIVFIYLSRSKYVLSKTYASPNSDYVLAVYEETGYKPFFSLASEQSFAKAYVVLKNKQGKLLLKPHWYASCDFLTEDLMIDWDENRVYFTKFNYIDLKNYTFSCY